LTLDPNRTRADGSPAWRSSTRGPSRESVEKLVRFWHREVSKTLGQEVAAVVAIESHKNGWPHCHPLLSVPGGLTRGDEIKVLGGKWFELAGYANLEFPRDQDAVAGYASKYLTKDYAAGEVMLLGPLGRTQIPLPGATLGKLPSLTSKEFTDEQARTERDVRPPVGRNAGINPAVDER
jgi:hypothetical protein